MNRREIPSDFYQRMAKVRRRHERNRARLDRLAKFGIGAIWGAGLLLLIAAAIGGGLWLGEKIG